MSTAIPTEHPHVHRDEQGRPVVGAAGLQLYVLAEYWRLGWSLDELAAGYPYLTMAEIVDALSFYLDHREEVEALIQVNRQRDPLTDAPTVQRLSGTLAQEANVDDYRRHLEEKYARNA